MNNIQVFITRALRNILTAYGEPKQDLTPAKYPPTIEGEYLAKCEDANGDTFFSVLYYRPSKCVILEWDKYFGETEYIFQPGWYGSQKHDPTVNYTKLVKAWMPLPK